MSNLVITIARGYGSGGKAIGKMLSKRLSIPCYDRSLLQIASDESGINISLFGQIDETLKGGILKRLSQHTKELKTPDDPDFLSESNLFNIQAETIKELASRESCVIIGRCADHILRESDQLVSIFLHADEASCAKSVMKHFGISEKEAREKIAKHNRLRGDFYKYYTGREWNNACNYDLSIDTGIIGYEKAVELILDYIDLKSRKHEDNER